MNWCIVFYRSWGDSNWPNAAGGFWSSANTSTCMACLPSATQTASGKSWRTSNWGGGKCGRGMLGDFRRVWCNEMAGLFELLHSLVDYPYLNWMEQWVQTYFNVGSLAIFSNNWKVRVLKMPESNRVGILSDPQDVSRHQNFHWMVQSFCSVDQTSVTDKVKQMIHNLQNNKL